MLTIFHKREVEEPSWLWYAYVVGYDEGDGGEGNGDGGAGDGGGDGDGDGDGDEPDESTPDGLKKALEAERKLRKTAEQKLKIATRKAANAGAKANAGGTQGTGADEGTGDQGTTEVDARVEKLTTALRDNSLKTTIAGLAANFHNPDDVYNFLDTKAFDYEQDDEDPTNVVWDEAEIRAAIKQLAKDRPYLLKPAGDGQQGGQGRQRQSGPKFAGKGSGRQTSGLTQADITTRFPAMRHAVRAGGNKNE